MSNKIDIKTLEALRQDSHEAFEEVFITYYGNKSLYPGLHQVESGC